MQTYEDKELEEFMAGEIFHDAQQDTNDDILVSILSQCDESIFDTYIQRCIYATTIAMTLGNHDKQQTKPHQDVVINDPLRSHIPATQDYRRLQRFFAWLPEKLIKSTFSNSTQYGFMPQSRDGNLFTRWHAPNPALNVFRLNNDVLNNKIFSDTPSLNSRYRHTGD